MAYWLAKEREGQISNPIQRFDPRFWTVDFARPMMASVVSTGPESITAKAVFYHQNALAGLIWESEDRWDHPLLAYETNRDYRRLTLSFHWKSSGIKPLNEINGPTLTIEGRDQNGAPRSWYVRLWNYASGNPTDAQITINFSDLSGGFLLPSEADPVYAADIDRMFISLVPINFDNSDNVIDPPQEAQVDITQIRCDGGGVMLDTGDIMVPEHEMQMASGYDDAYNLTPARILRQIRGLGYRGSINHYVGMSHYFRLEAVPVSAGDAHYVSLRGGVLNDPCVSWHENFVKLCKDADYDLIFSLSYEIFDAHCWNDWKQRDLDGNPALTGYIPPSALVSPAHDGAIGYLRTVALAFSKILVDGGLPLRFQVGEPWWWITLDGKICLYDDRARAAFGDLLTDIPTIYGAQSEAQKAMLDRAGELLSASTAVIANSVKQYGEDSVVPAQTLLLVYLPTVLDERAPDALRANVPLGWSAPAFDILQLEDYDWVITGNHGATLRATELMTQRLSYPTKDQHYFSGFVLRADEKSQWFDINFAAEAAIARGIPHVFIWALPQVSRDGYLFFNLNSQTHDNESLARQNSGNLNKDIDMQSFADVDFPISLSQNAVITAEFSTNIVTSDSGHEFRNSNWADARMRYDVGPAIRSDDDAALLIDFFRARRGSAIGFRFRDIYDYSSSANENIDALDQNIGIGDGFKTRFNLIKNYGFNDSDEPQLRIISRPVRNSVMVAVDGTQSHDWALSNGKVVFDTAPPIGAIISAGYLFDVPVRFAQDSLDLAGVTYGAFDSASIPLIEIKEAS